MSSGSTARVWLVVIAWAWLAAGCAGSRISRGLLDPTDATMRTLAERGDIGLDPPASRLRQADLPSGLRVGFERADTRGMVGVVLVVGAGSTADPRGKEGLAHLIEHLSFHARDGGRTVTERLARLAATYNADTSLDRTRFYEFAPRAALPELLRLASQRLTHPLAGVDKEAFAVEREIIENELRQRNESLAYGQVSAWMHHALFPADHPYSRPVGGDVASVRRLTLEDARAFADAAYDPRNATLLIVGDFDPDAAVAGVDRDFPQALIGDPQAPRKPTRGAHDPARPAELPPAAPGGFETMKAPVAWPEIWLSYYLADMYGPYAPAMKVLTAPAVVKALRAVLLEDDDVTDVAVGTTELRQATVLMCRITLVDGRRRGAIADRARELMASLWRPPAAGVGVGDGDEATPTPWGGGASLTTLAKTRQLALADAILDTESFTGRAVARADYFHMTGAVGAYDALIRAVAALPYQALVDHGTYLLAADRARVLHVEPLPEEQRPLPGPVGVPSIDNRRVSEVPPEGMDFGDPPPVAPVPELSGARLYTLANGLRVALVRRPQFPAITAVLGFRGGAPASPLGVIELVRLLERDGSFALDGNALEIRKMDGDDFSADMVVAGRRNLSSALFMLSARLRVIDGIDWRPVLGEVQRIGGQAAAARKEPPATKARRAFWRALYGDHPYGRVLGLAELRGVQRQAIEAWLPRLYNPANATLVVAGDFEVERTAQLIGGWFGGWTALDGTGPLAVPTVPPVLPGKPRETVLVTHRPGSTQVSLAIGCRLPGGNDPRNLATARMLAGVVVGHLNARLREEAGAAYTVSGSADVLTAGGSHLVVGAAIDNRRFRDALRIIRGHWDYFGRGKFDRGTLSQARWSLVRMAQLGFQTSSETALRVLDATNQGWSPESLGSFPDLYRRVTAGDLARAFATCRSSTVLSLLGDEPAIRAALAPPEGGGH